MTATVERSGLVAVRSKFLGPTNHRGSRIRVWRADVAYSDDTNSLTVPWDYSLDPGGNHDAAIAEYLTRSGWDDMGTWVTGSTDVGAVAVRTSNRKETTSS